jgi:hypothetical protein
MLALLIFQVLACTAVASDEGSTVLRTFGDYTIVRESATRLPGGAGSRLVDKPTDLKVVSNTMKLRHVEGNSLSSTFVRAMRDAGRGTISAAARAVVSLPYTMIASSFRTNFLRPVARLSSPSKEATYTSQM